MSKLLLPLFICLLSTAASAASQESEWPEGSAMRVGEVEVQRRDQAGDVLAREERKLLRLISRAGEASPQGHADTRLVAALKAQQLAWKRYVPGECEVAGSLTGAGGTWPSTYAVKCEANLTENRVLRTRAAIHCVEKIAPTSRWLDQNHCLYQLMPLAVPLRP
ncbi:lysozyme inhibitor LprI family protein [Caulobacter sp. LARHSG274]